MLFLEGSARALLVVHAILAAALVAASTHHALWCRGYLRGQFGRRRAERRFALVVTVAFAATFTLGNLLYPTYKVRVRAEYLDSPSAVSAEAERRRAEAERIGDAPPPRERAGDLSWVARLFDVKEHWVALGLAASLALLAVGAFAHPADERRALPVYLGLSLLVCATAWTGAVIGLLTASFRSVGAA